VERRSWVASSPEISGAPKSPVFCDFSEILKWSPQEMIAIVGDDERAVPPRTRHIVVSDLKSRQYKIIRCLLTPRGDRQHDSQSLTRHPDLAKSRAQLLSAAVQRAPGAVPDRLGGDELWCTETARFCDFSEILQWSPQEMIAIVGDDERAVPPQTCHVDWSQ
jgi:hypothetical protein